MSKLSMPLTPGGYMRATLSRGDSDATVLDLRPDGYTFDPNPPAYNYNAFAAFASAAAPQS